MGVVSISKGNSKMGAIQSVSLPAVVTCRACDCQQKCYARKLEKIRRTVAQAYKNNLQVLIEAPDIYWREVEATIMLSRYFRFHVSGDIPNKEYFSKMVEVATRQKHCDILCFTKKFEIVNEYIAAHGGLPRNLHMVFSAWVGLEMINPFSLPVAQVRYKDGTCFASPDAKQCGGNCTECAIVGEGCWTLEKGEEIVFNEH